jgi:predicted O-methyltransferase YrrM
MLNPRRVLEIGTYTGYATLCMAEGMEVGSLLHTVERNDELEPFVRRYISQSADREKIVLHWGDVVDVLPTLGEIFDLVYMDADKRDYCAHYELVFPHVRVGGMILADNTLWSGKVIDGVEKLDSQTRGIMSFNDRISADTRIEKIIIPLRDGLTMIYKRSEC